METILQVTIGDLLVISIPLALVFMFLGWLAKNWLIARLEKSIQHEYDKHLEDYKDSRLRRQKAALIAELFSKWIKYYGRETALLKKEELIDHYEILNKLSMELSLWLEDESIYKDIMNRLQNLEGAKDLRELVGDVRAYLLEKDREGFQAQNIVLWPIPGDIDKIYGPKPGARDASELRA